MRPEEVCITVDEPPAGEVQSGATVVPFRRGVPIFFRKRPVYRTDWGIEWNQGLNRKRHNDGEESIE